MDIGEVVVVQAGAFQVLIVKQEAERLNEMQREPGACTQADRVASVTGNDGVVEDDVHVDESKGAQRRG